MTFDAIIAGGGIIGAACAAELLRAGLSVAIVEPNGLASGATAAAMGHIAVMDDSPAQLALTLYSQQLWANLAPHLPPDAEYDRIGSLWVAADAEELAEIHRKHRNMPSEILDPQSLAEAEPQLRPGLAGALFLPNDAVLNPAAATRYLATGATLIESHVTSFDDSGAWLTGGKRLHASFSIAACPTIAGLPTQPRKGHLLLTEPHPGFLRHQVIELGYLKSAHIIAEDSVAFNVQPRRNGQVLIGSSRQFGVTDSKLDAHIMTAMLARAAEYMPALATLRPQRSWTGFRSATPDKLPLIGLAPGFENVYVATGHEGLGITTSLATAKLLAARILGFPSPIPAAPYDSLRTLNR